MNKLKFLLEKYIDTSNVEESNIIILSDSGKKSVHTFYFTKITKQNSTETKIIRFIPLLFVDNGKTIFLIENENYSYDSKDNIFKLSLHHYFKTATLSGIGKGFYIYPKFIRGFGIGTFAFFNLFTWAMEKNCGNYSLNKQPIGGDEEDHLLRFLLYLNTGLSLTAEAVKTECKKGEYFASAIKNLTPHLPDKLIFHGSIKKYSDYLSKQKDNLKIIF
jgi:hypothetical protein